MVALNRVPQEAVIKHLKNALKNIEKSIIENSLLCGLDPNEINPDTHPLPNESTMHPLEARLADRVKAYKDLLVKIESMS